MGLSHHQQVSISASEGFKTPVYKPIVHNEINQTIQGNTQSNKKAIIKVLSAKIHQQQRKPGKQQRKQIVPFEKRFSFLMMTFMHKPQWAMK